MVCSGVLDQPARLPAGDRRRLPDRVPRRPQPVPPAARRARAAAGPALRARGAGSARRRACSTSATRTGSSPVVAWTGVGARRLARSPGSPSGLRPSCRCWPGSCSGCCTCRSSTSGRRSTASAGSRCCSRPASSPIFLGPADIAPPILVLSLLRWLLFRVEFGAGLIKMRGDPCWRDLTCLDYHHETQPMPNPLSWCFHHLPHAAAPGRGRSPTTSPSSSCRSLLFAPQPVATVAARGRSSSPSGGWS